jgi:hypothetical protein
MRNRAGKSKAPTIRPHFIPPIKALCAPMRRGANFSRISLDSKRIMGVLQRVKICLLN